MPLSKAVGQMIFKTLSGRGFTAAELISLARKAGGTYRRTDMLADIRTYEGRVLHQAQTERLSFDSKVPHSWMTETSLKQPVKYRVHGWLTTYDEAEDAYYTTRASFYTNDYAAVGEYGESFTTAFYGAYEDQALEITEFQTSFVEHNQTFSY